MGQKKCKVIQFIKTVLEGGAEALVRDYGLMLDKNVFDVVVVCIYPHPKAPNWIALKNNNIKIVTIYPYNILQRWNILGRLFNKLFGKKYISWRLEKIIEKEKPDIIHVHLQLLEYLHIISRTLEKIELFFTCHNDPEVHWGKEYPQEIAAVRYLIKHNGLRLIGLHRNMALELNQMFGVSNSVVINNAVDLYGFRHSGVTKEQERISLGIPTDAFVIGHVGRFAEQKNHKFLVEIFAEIVKRNSKAYLLMVGAGDLQKEIVCKLDKLGLHGRYQILSHRGDVNQIMQAMDVFVFPSLFEGLGIVAIEAQASGLRCVMSDGVPKEAFLTETAIRLPLGDVKQWADVALDIDRKGPILGGSLDDWDMRKEIKKLEKLYLREL